MSQQMPKRSPAGKLIHDMRNSLMALMYATKAMPLAKSNEQKFAELCETIDREIDELKQSLDALAELDASRAIGRQSSEPR